MLFSDHQKIAPQYAFVLGCKGCTQLVATTPMELGTIPKVQDTVANKEMIEMLKEHNTWIGELEIDSHTIRKFMSIQVGQMLGLDFQSMLEPFYHDESRPTDLGMVGYAMNKYNIPDFRFVQFDFMLMGMIQSSLEVRNTLLEGHAPQMIESSRAMSTLAHLLLNSDRVHEFLRWSSTYATSSQEITLAIPLARLVYSGIKTAFARKYEEFTIMACTNTFRSLDKGALTGVCFWAVKLMDMHYKYEER